MTRFVAVYYLLNLQIPLNISNMAQKEHEKHVYSIFCAKIPQKSTLEIISGTVTTDTDETDEDVKGKDTSDGMVDKKVKDWDTA